MHVIVPESERKELIEDLGQIKEALDEAIKLLKERNEAGARPYVRLSGRLLSTIDGRLYELIQAKEKS